MAIEVLEPLKDLILYLHSTDELSDVEIVDHLKVEKPEIDIT
jgi:hypothetical protein